MISFIPLLGLCFMENIFWTKLRVRKKCFWKKQCNYMAFLHLLNLFSPVRLAKALDTCAADGPLDLGGLLFSKAKNLLVCSHGEMHP